MCLSTAAPASLQCLRVVLLGRHRVFASICPCVQLRNSPGHHYEEVQAVPCVSKVTLLAKDPQGHHLDHHLNGKECEDEVIEVLQNKAKGGWGDKHC